MLNSTTYYNFYMQSLKRNFIYLNYFKKKKIKDLMKINANLSSIVTTYEADMKFARDK